MTNAARVEYASEAPEEVPAGFAPQVVTGVLTDPGAAAELVAATQDLDDQAGSIDTVRVDLNDIGKVALLEAAEEVDLAKQIEAGLYAGKLRFLASLSGADRLQALDDLRNPPAVPGKKRGANKERLSENIDGIERHMAQIDSMDPTERRGYLRLLGQVEQEGAQAKDQLLTANLRLVVSEAKKHVRPGFPLPDLIQEGNLGAIRAVEKFDYTKGFKFSTYATNWIKQALARAKAEMGSQAHIPTHVVEDMNKIMKIKDALTQDLGREPTIEELAKESGMETEDVAEHLEWRRIFDGKIGWNDLVGEEGSEIGHFIEDTKPENQPGTEIEQQAQATSNKDVVASALGLLTDQEAEVIQLRLGLNGRPPHSQREVGAKLRKSGSWIGKLEKDAYAKLRDPSNVRRLRESLEYSR